MFNNIHSLHVRTLSTSFCKKKTKHLFVKEITIKNANKSLNRLLFKDVCGCNEAKTESLCTVDPRDTRWIPHRDDRTGGSWERCNLSGHHTLSTPSRRS